MDSTNFLVFYDIELWSQDASTFFDRTHEKHVRNIGMFLAHLL